MKNIAVLISNKGTGTNLQAIIEGINKGKINGRISVVLSNSSKAFGLERAINQQIQTHIFSWKKYKEAGKTREAYSKDLAKLLKETCKAEIVVFAGWSLLLSKEFFAEFPDSVLNIHPGILSKVDDITLSPAKEKLPENVGLMTDDAIKMFLNGGYKYAGSTLHFAVAATDSGPVITHVFERIKSGDTVESLYPRLKKKEHKMLVEGLHLLCEGKLLLKSQR